MKSSEARPGAWVRLTTLAAAAVITVTACGPTTPSGSTAAPPPTANLTPQTTIGPGEGQRNLIAWEGYTDTSWTKPFTAATGCKVNAHYAGISDDMVTLMAGGGGGQWDLVSASGDADLRLIYNGDVRPMNPDLIPDFADFQP